MMFIDRFTKEEKGMTLVETVVSVSILLIAITGPMVLAYQSIKATRDARYELAATHLASEAFEVIHSIRSNNSADDTSLDGNAWLNNILVNCPTGCIIDLTKQRFGFMYSNYWDFNVVEACPVAGCASMDRLFYHTESGLYRQSGSFDFSQWRASPYRRYIELTPIGGVNPYAVNIKITVTYERTRGGDGKIVINEDLYAWFPQIST